MKDRFDIHQGITNRIVSAIEAGAGEFKLPWHHAAEHEIADQCHHGARLSRRQYSVLVDHDASLGLQVA